MAKTYPKLRQVNFCRCLDNIQQLRKLAVRQSRSDEGHHLTLTLSEFGKVGLYERGHRLQRSAARELSEALSLPQKEA
jgi:hypothetical protein